jgi:hypothetical protein
MLDRSACAVFSQGKPHEVPWLIRPIQEIEGSPSYSQSVCGPTKELAEKVLLEGESSLSGFYETAVGSKAVPGFLLLGVLFLLE